MHGHWLQHSSCHPPKEWKTVPEHSSPVEPNLGFYPWQVMLKAAWTNSQRAPPTGLRWTHRTRANSTFIILPYTEKSCSSLSNHGWENPGSGVERSGLSPSLRSLRPQWAKQLVLPPLIASSLDRMNSTGPSRSSQCSTHFLRAYYIHKEAISQFPKTICLQMVHMIIIIENAMNQNTLFLNLCEQLKSTVLW